MAHNGYFDQCCRLQAADTALAAGLQFRDSPVSENPCNISSAASLLSVGRNLDFPVVAGSPLRGRSVALRPQRMEGSARSPDGELR